MSSTLEAQSLNHWTAREVLHLFVLNHLYFYPFQEFCKDGREERCLFFSQILLRSFFCFCFFFKLYKNELTQKQLNYYCLLLTQCKSVEVSLKLFRTPFFAGLCLGAGTE